MIVILNYIIFLTKIILGLFWSTAVNRSLFVIENMIFYIKKLYFRLQSILYQSFVEEKQCKMYIILLNALTS